MLKPSVKLILFTVFKTFRKACIFDINSQATNLRQNICNKIHNEVSVRAWINSISGCECHKIQIINLIVTAKLFLLIKRHNQVYKKPKSFDQTRAQLMYQ